MSSKLYHRALSGAAVVVCAAAAQGAHQYTSGHADIRAVYDGGQLTVLMQGDSSTVIDGSPLGSGHPIGAYRFAGGDVDIIVPDNAQTKFTVTPTFPNLNLGKSVGDDVWVLSQNPISTQPFFGFSTESVPGGVFSGGIRFQLVDFVGPGEFSLWQAGVFGAFTFFNTTIDGISAADALTRPTGSHDHYNWGFSAPGVYEVTWQASGTLLNGSTLTSEPSTFTFVVVPTPSTAAAALLSCGLLAGRRRR